MFELMATAAVASPDAAEFSRFVEAELARPLSRRKVGGAVLVAVKDGRELYRFAYGLADVERRVPVDVDRSMFAIASISKTFTATAVAQLKARGLVDWSDPANRRLTSFGLGQPHGVTTVANLLTHSTGAPDLFLGAACRDASDCPPLARFLAERQPRQRVRPGRFVSYSNLGNAVAGQMVEDVSGLPYGEYLRRNLFGPLGMRDTRYAVPGEPDAADPAARPARPYELDGAGRLVRSPPYVSIFYPAGQIQASGADMGRWMTAHLEAGSPILPDAVRLDMQRLHARTPGFDEGYGWGWSIRRVGPTTVIGHGGDLRGAVSDLRMIPEARFGYFVGVTGDAGSVLQDFARAFDRRFLPSPAPPPAPRGGTVPADLPGTYQDFRFAEFDPLQMLSVLNETTVRRVGPGEVEVVLPRLVGGGARRFLADGPDLFRTADGTARLRVIRDAAGGVSHFALAADGYDLLAERLPPWRRTSIKLPALAASLLGMFAAVAAALVMARRALGAGHGALALGALAGLAFPVWAGAALASASQWDILYGLKALGIAPAFALPWASLLALLAAAVLWRRRPGATAYGLAIAAGLAYLGLLAANAQFQFPG